MTMAHISSQTLQDLHDHLKKQKVFSFQDFHMTLGCSVRCARTHLKSWKTMSSYNHNGGYYTLPGIPKFDHHGLWHHPKASFSQYGTLKQTMIQLVTQSEAGLLGRQIGEILGGNPASYLHLLRDAPLLF